MAYNYYKSQPSLSSDRSLIYIVSFTSTVRKKSSNMGNLLIMASALLWIQMSCTGVILDDPVRIQMILKNTFY